MRDDEARERLRRYDRERSARAHAVRHKTDSVRVHRKLTMLISASAREELEAARPRTRGDCEGGIRPCPFVACKYNLYLDVGPNGSIRFNFPDREPGEMVESCALDVVDEAGGRTLEVVGALVNLTRERVRQIENKAIELAQRAAERAGLHGEDD